MKIKMLDLKGQYDKIKQEIDAAIQGVLDETAFIQGAEVKEFETNLAGYLGIRHVISCANGTDALQISMMALGLKQGDEVIVPSFTYVATAEVIALLGLTPVLVDVDPATFNIKIEDIEPAITGRTKAIVPVHLFGQCAPMEAIMEIAKKYSLYVIEDNAQALGAKYSFKNGSERFAGTIGDVGCTSFFPSKNLGCFGDGGAIFTNDDKLAEKLRMVANHGQLVKYHHDIVGCNSRLDTIQAAVLNVKLSKLDGYACSRGEAAAVYKELIKDIPELILPAESSFSTHVYHQFTIRCKQRDSLKAFLAGKGIPTMIYYPLPLHKQRAFSDISVIKSGLDVSERLCEEVLSLPIHTELTREEQEYIASNIRYFFINCK